MSSSRALVYLLLLLYFFSGVTGLAYEVLWARLLTQLFGSSVFGVVITVAAFMGGLGAGSICASKYAFRLARPLKVFAFLELAVAVFAIVLPWGMRVIQEAALAVASDASVSMWFGAYGTAAFIFLFIPAFALGAGFPLVLAAARERISMRLIYGINTLGGAAGAILPLLLLPGLGWVGAEFTVATMAIIVAVVAFCLSPHLTVDSTAGHERRNQPSAVERALSKRILLAYFGVGFAALLVQVAWVRLFGMILLRTEYVLAIILSVYLIGIGLGALLADLRAVGRWLKITTIFAVFYIVAGLWFIPYVAAWAQEAEFFSLADAMFVQGTLIAFCTLPVTIVFGAWLPLLVKLVGGDEHSEVTSTLYGCNAIGAVLGVLVGGIILIPLLGTPASVVLAALLLILMLFLVVNDKKILAAFLVFIPVSLPVLTMPSVSVLLPVTQADARDVYVHEDALTLTHVVEKEDGQRLLLADLQRMDASSDPSAVAAQQNQARLPLLLHDAPKSVLFLGLGTGVSMSGSRGFPELERTAVELSRGAIEASHQWFSEFNDEVFKHSQIVQDDARRFLQTTSLEYDVIVGDLFHPDLVGRSALLSKQQFERAHARLSEGGVFVQWLALNQFDRDGLEVVFRTFASVYQHNALFLDGFRVALVGRKGVEIKSDSMLKNTARLEFGELSQVTGGEGVWTWLGRFWGPVPHSEGVYQDEWAPYLEFSLPKMRYFQDDALRQTLELMISIRPRVNDAAALLSVADQDGEQFERAYIAMDLVMRSWLANFKGRSGESQRLLRMAYEANPADRWVGFNLADQLWLSLDGMVERGFDQREGLSRILSIRPDHVDALKAMWRLEKAQGNQVRAEEFFSRARQNSPLDIELRSVN